MPTYIIHKDGVYNFFSTVVDAPYFVHGLTLEQVTEYTREKYGSDGLAELPFRLERAHANGCSARYEETLEEAIRLNRAGPNESRLSFEDFVAQYLTIPKEPALTTDRRMDGGG